MLKSAKHREAHQWSQDKAQVQQHEQRRKTLKNIRTKSNHVGSMNNHKIT